MREVRAALEWMRTQGLLGLLTDGVTLREGTDSTTGAAVYELPHAVGPKGVTGPIGPDGDTGPSGPPGNDFVGLPGEMGDEGDEGDQGDPGDNETAAGPKGPDGVKGAKGDKGDQGPIGDKGPRGADATDSSIVGPQGEKGDTGPPGDKLAIATVTVGGVTSYHALHVIEAPRFELIDVLTLTLDGGPAREIRMPLDPRWLATLDSAHAIDVRSIHPRCVAEIHGVELVLHLPARPHRTTWHAQLAGIARGHGRRFTEYTDAQREKNAAKWREALNG